jgi:F-type H+-transporting ATPase subunit b
MTRSRHVFGRPVTGAAPGGRAGTVVAMVLAVLAGPGLACAAEEGGHSLIEVNSTLLVQLVSFLLLLAVLFRFVYRPLIATLEARTGAIRTQLAEAQAAREAAQRQLAEFEARLQAAQAEAQTVREQALREAAETRERLTGEARQEATRLLESARAEIQHDVRRAKAELRAEVGTLAVEIAERLIQKSLRGEDQERLVQDALARLDAR